VSLVLTALALRFASAYGKLLLVPCYGRNAVRPLKKRERFYRERAERQPANRFRVHRFPKREMRSAARGGGGEASC